MVKDILIPGALGFIVAFIIVIALFGIIQNPQIALTAFVAIMVDRLMNRFVKKYFKQVK